MNFPELNQWNMLTERAQGIIFGLNKKMSDTDKWSANWRFRDSVGISLFLFRLR
jgi:hypothetical protein